MAAPGKPGHSSLCPGTGSTTLLTTRRTLPEIRGRCRRSQVKIDTAAPAAPTGLTAVPTSWSRTNSFDLAWTSPSDASGVTGLYVKLGDLSGGGAPTGPTDGTPMTQTQRIDGLTVPARRRVSCLPLAPRRGRQRESHDRARKWSSVALRRHPADHDRPGAGQARRGRLVALPDYCYADIHRGRLRLRGPALSDRRGLRGSRQPRIPRPCGSISPTSM